MEDVRQIIADNLTAVRKSAKITQAELAARLNYSDKAVSKWERGESTPDVVVLKEIADLFAVPVDYFLTAHSDSEEKPHFEREKKILHFAVFLTSEFAAMAVATIVYYVFLGAFPEAHFQWKIYVAALPLFFLLPLVFNAVWWRKAWIYLVSIAGMLSSGIGTAYVFMPKEAIASRPWILFFLLIPLLAIVLVWTLLFRRKQTRRGIFPGDKGIKPKPSSEAEEEK